MAVDPNDPNTVYIAGMAGDIHRTQDGGNTWTVLNASGNPLSGVVETANTTATTSSGTSITVVPPADVQSMSSGATPAGFNVNVVDLNNITALVPVPATPVNINSSNATSLTLISGVAGTVTNGDTLIFGYHACIVFDASSGTDANGRTKGIYIGWPFGATHVYHSTDAGNTFSATTGGPAKVCRLACSSDGVVYAVDFNFGDAGNASSANTNAWKFQSGTWTNFTTSDMTAGAAGSGNPWRSCAADPNNLGHVAFFTDASNLQFSDNYGNAGTWYSGPGGIFTRSAADVPWLANANETYMTHGSCAFDPAVSGRLYFAEGIGVWYLSPAANHGGLFTPTTVTSQTVGAPSLIVDKILKPPGQNLFVTVQDRIGLSLSSVTAEPSQDVAAQLGLGIVHGMGYDYAKGNASFQVLVATANIYSSTNGGSNWSILTQPSNNPVFGEVAVQTSSNFVWFPANINPVVTTNGGSTWSNCSFNSFGSFTGPTLSTGWGNFGRIQIVVADLVSSTTYYAINLNASASGGGLWRSTDSGSTWTNMTSGIVTGISTTGATGIQLIAVPGNQGHLFLSQGNFFNNGLQLYRSVDGGATWVAVSNTGVCWQVAAGQTKPGSAYPTIYMTGTANGDTNPGVYRATNFTSNTGVSPTWVRLCDAPAQNLTSSSSLSADQEDYRKFYAAMGPVGYTYGIFS